jgi:DNA-binding GntR family transcriptional regulator
MKIVALNQAFHVSMVVMTDNDIIAEAYAQQVRNIWTIFYEVMISKPTDAEIKRSEQAFARGVATARQVRDRAIELLKAS